ALGLAAVCEVAYLADFLAGGAAYRMNTVFKLYEQAWPLFAIASAAALATMMGPLTLPSWPRPRFRPAVGIVAAPARPDKRREREDVGARPSPGSPQRGSPLWRLWLATLGLLVVAV